MQNTSKPILAGQTLIDIAVQELGDASRAFEVARLNAMSVTDDLEVGAVVLIPDVDIDKRSLVQMFTSKFLAPASEDITGDIISKDSGIDYDSIEIDLIVQ
jgi:hypothetical protein